MAVYFVTDADVSTGESYPVKIGYSGDLKRRRGQLQTGNWRKLILMGHITDGRSKEGLAREKELHRKFGKLRIDQSEWFWMEPQQVLDALTLYSTCSYLSFGSEPFEIISFDRDGAPEFASPWDWGRSNLMRFVRRVVGLAAGRTVRIGVVCSVWNAVSQNITLRQITKKS